MGRAGYHILANPAGRSLHFPNPETRLVNGDPSNTLPSDFHLVTPHNNGLPGLPFIVYQLDPKRMVKHWRIYRLVEHICEMDAPAAT